MEITTTTMAGHSGGRMMQQDLERNIIIEQGSYYLTWEDLTVLAAPTFVGNGPTKRIIDGVSGFAEPGRLLAIMGPSGSGKSTLLDALAGRLSGNVVMSGEILLNGNKTRLDYGVVAYVRQEDTMLGTLTVRETIAYSATLRLPYTMTKQEITATVNSTITDMGLEDCADRLIGNWHLRGISGGEKRRLSIALEILTRPRLLFLDEPTSGLDGAAAFFVSQILKNLARHGQTIVSSIHQPSSEVFSLFDDLLLLAGGETVYFGEGKLAIEFFNNSGVPCPARRNPSDHFLRCVNSGFDKVTETLKLPVESVLNMSTTEIKEMLVYKYKSSKYAKKATSRIHEVTQNMKGNSIKMLKGSEARWSKQLWTLTKRSSVNMSRDFGYYWLRIAVYIAVSICVGTVFFNIGNSYTALLARGSCGGFLSGFMIMMSIGGFPSFIEEMKIFYKERMNGHYGVGVFILSNFLSSIPFLFLMSISTASITYNLVKFRSGFGHFAFSCLNLLCSIAVVESCMMVVASLVPNFLMGLIVGAGLIGIMMLTAGFFRFYPQIPKPFWRYPVSYINYMAWGLQGATSVVAHCMAFVGFVRGFWRALLTYDSEHGYVHGLNHEDPSLERQRLVRRPYSFGRGIISRGCDNTACPGRGSDSESWRRAIPPEGCGCVHASAQRGYNSFASLDQRFIRRSWPWRQDRFQWGPDGIECRPYSFGRGNDMGRWRGLPSRGSDTSSESWRRAANIGCGFVDHSSSVDWTFSSSQSQSQSQLSPRLVPQPWPFGPVFKGGPASFGNVDCVSSDGASTFSSLGRKSCDGSNGFRLSSFGHPRKTTMSCPSCANLGRRSPPSVLKRKCKVRVGFKSFVLLEDKTLCKTIVREIWRGRVRDLVLEKWECVWLASRIMKAETCSESFGYLGSISNDNYRLECSMRRNLLGSFIKIAKTGRNGRSMFMCIPTRVSGKIWSPLVEFLESSNCSSGRVQNDGGDGLASCKSGSGINVGIARARKLSSKSKRTGKSFQLWIEKKKVKSFPMWIEKRKGIRFPEPCREMVVYKEANEDHHVPIVTSLDHSPILNNFHSLKMLGLNQAWKSLKWIGWIKDIGLGLEVDNQQLQLVVYKGPPLICDILATPNFCSISKGKGILEVWRRQRRQPCANYIVVEDVIGHDSKYVKEKDIDWDLIPSRASKIIKVRKKKKHKSRLRNVLKKIGRMMSFDRRSNDDDSSEMEDLMIIGMDHRV